MNSHLKDTKIINKLISDNNDFWENCTDIDNNNIYKLFKRLYVKKNIVQSDYDNLKDNFEKFVPEKFLSEIWRKSSGRINIGSSIEKFLHIMFVDISGFTKMSENLSAANTLILLNIYFDAIVEISKKNWWYVDKFLWDWIMLVFDDKNSDSAIRTAIEIRQFMKKINLSKLREDITVWIWINSWNAILWTIGSRNRMDITIIWDNVNIASRLEDMTRKLDDWIIISESTYNWISDKKLFDTHSIGKKEIRGRDSRIHLYWISES